MERTLLKEYKNGNKLWGIRTHCAKCGGTGKVIWTYADHVCFDCGGKGWYWEEEREYTPENLAKREARAAKKAAEEATEREAKRAEQEARETAWKAEQEAREAEWRGHYYGEVGQKIELEVRFVYAKSFNGTFGVVNVHRFDTDDGAHLIWKTGSEIGGMPGSKDERIVCEGDRIKIRATIKAHKEYNGMEQTELTRVKLIEGGKPVEA